MTFSVTRSLPLLWPVLVLLATASLQAADERPAGLWTHLSSAEDLSDVRGTSAHFDDSGEHRVLKLNVSALNMALGETARSAQRGLGWVSIPPPAGGWNVSLNRTIQASVTNTASTPALTTLWVVSSGGWDAVGAATTLQPGQTETLTCNLRETYPDGTPRIDPR